MKFVPKGVTTRVARTLLKTKKSSPTVMFAAGVVGMVGTVVLASKATLKLEDALAESNSKLDIANTLQHESYTEDDRKKDKLYIYTRSVVAVGKLYGPAIVLGVVSIGLLAGSHNVLTKRNASLTAAYAALDKGFNEYRARVVDEFGEDKDRELRYGFEMCEISDEKTGKIETVKRISPNGNSIYARFFDQTCSSWEKTPEFNLIFARVQQQYANNMLQARGHIFLNEVYDLFGIPRSKAGACVGWVMTKGGKSAGDNYVDFGLFNGKTQESRDFVNGYEGAILLDFNVDGVILDKI